jgi:hypothetical protein
MCCKKLTTRCGSEWLTVFGCTATILSCIGILYLPANNWTYIYFLAILLGIGTGIVGVSALSLICNLVGECCESGAFVVRYIDTLCYLLFYLFFSSINWLFVFVFVVWFNVVY